MNRNGDQSEATPEPPAENGYGRPPEATRFKKGVLEIRRVVRRALSMLRLCSLRPCGRRS
jgi:hypothetical protein